MRKLSIWVLGWGLCLSAVSLSAADDAAKKDPPTAVLPSAKPASAPPAAASPPAKPTSPAPAPAIAPAPPGSTTNKPASPATTPAATRPTVPPADLAQIERWIAELNSDRYDVREAATRKLGQADRTAVDPLVKAAEGENLEVSARAIRALQMLYFQAEESTYSAAEKALEKLAESLRQGIARRAVASTFQQVAAQQKRALQRLEKQGAMITYEGSPTFIPTGLNGEKLVREVRLDEKWAGGDAIVSLARQLASPNLKLYLIDGANVSKEAEDELVKTLPGLTIQHRGQALLGVEGRNSPTGRGCEVASVKAGSGAEKAGLQPNDLLLKYDGIEVKSFEDIIDATRKHKPGDKIPIEVSRTRNSEESILKLTVTLGGWR